MKWVTSGENTEKNIPYLEEVKCTKESYDLLCTINNYSEKNKEESIKVINELPTNTELVWILYYNWPSIQKIWLILSLYHCWISGSLLK